MNGHREKKRMKHDIRLKMRFRRNQSKGTDDVCSIGREIQVRRHEILLVTFCERRILFCQRKALIS